MTTRKSKSRTTHAGDTGFSLISSNKLRALYAAMLHCRLLQELVGLLSRGKQRAAFSGSNREASAAGVILDLLPGDSLFAPHGDLASRFLKGVSLETIFSTIRSSRRQGIDAPSPCNLRVNVFPALETFADRLDVAMRAARLGAPDKKITVLVMDSQEPDGDVVKALRSAAAARLPLLFVCHSRSKKADLAHQALRCGLPGIVVDEADVVAMYRVASEAITHARRGNGPTLIECRLWRPQSARRQQRAGRDAIRNMEAHLSGKGLFSSQFKADVVSRFKAQLDQVAATARGRARKSAAKRRSRKNRS
jgi:2-oxoisovalerate dehydrogenase E1 component alpha subunit